MTERVKIHRYLLPLAFAHNAPHIVNQMAVRAIESGYGKSTGRIGLRILAQIILHDLE
jgi:hypothetical protein